MGAPRKLSKWCEECNIVFVVYSYLPRRGGVIFCPACGESAGVANYINQRDGGSGIRTRWTPELVAKLEPILTGKKTCTQVALELGLTQRAVQQKVALVRKSRKEGKKMLLIHDHCLVDGCPIKPYASGYCRSHWYKLRKYGDPLAERPERPAKLCKIEGCGGKIYYHGYCRKHGHRYKSYGDPHLKAVGRDKKELVYAE